MHQYKYDHEYWCISLALGFLACRVYPGLRIVAGVGFFPEHPLMMMEGSSGFFPEHPLMMMMVMTLSLPPSPHAPPLPLAVAWARMVAERARGLC